MVTAIRFAGLAVLAATVAFAQKGGAPSGGTGGTTSGGTGGRTTSPTTTTTSPTNTPNSNTNTPPTQPPPIFINGQVLMEEGGPPPDRVSIERVCSGGTYREGWTDSRGYFSIQLGAQNALFADASMDTSPTMFGNNGMNSQGNSMSQNATSLNSLYSCELRASLSGFHSESVSLATRRSMDNGDIGVIILRRMVKVDGYTTSATIVLAPKEARKAYEKGLGYIKKNKPDEAQTEFLHAVEIFPRHAGAWFELGKVYEQRNHLDEARDAYHKANAADGNFVNPYERLYLMALHDSKWADAADLTDKVMRLNPYDFPSSYFYNALANANLNRWDAAEKSAREAAKLRGTEAMPKSLFILGFVQANKGDLPGSVESLHSYLKTGPATADRDRAQKLLGQVQQDLDAKNQTAKAPVQQQ
jgi:tetratricopeptide (TPR) repeat protein